MHSLSDLDLLEVINSAGAFLLQQTLQDKALAMAAPVTKINREAETAVIPRITDVSNPAESNRRMGGKLRSRFAKTIGNDTVDVAEFRDSVAEVQDRMGDGDND